MLPICTDNILFYLNDAMGIISSTLMALTLKKGGEIMDFKPFLVLFIFITLDVVSGLIKAFYKKEYNSSIMREGAYHKFCEIFIVLLCVLSDMFLSYVNVDIGVALVPIVLAYFVVMEICSVIENIGAINPQAVAPISKFFEKLRGSDD